MFKEGTRVVIVDEVKAEREHALVHCGQLGTIGTPQVGNSVRVHMDGDLDPLPWAMPASCVKAIRETSQHEGGKEC